MSLLNLGDVLDGLQTLLLLSAVVLSHKTCWIAFLDRFTQGTIALWLIFFSPERSQSDVLHLTGFPASHGLLGFNLFFDLDLYLLIEENVFE